MEQSQILVSMSKESSLSSFEKKIVRLIKEHSSIVWVKSYNKEYIYDIISQLSSENGYEPLNFRIEKERILTWNISDGKRVFGKSTKSTAELVKICDMVKDFKDRGNDKNGYEVLILDDISNLLSQSQEEANTLIALLQEFVYNNSKWRAADRKNGIKPCNKQTIIIISPRLEIVDNLNHMIEVVEEPVPDETDIQKELGFDKILENKSILKEIVRDKEKNGCYSYGRYTFSRGFMRKFEANSKKLVSSLKGMSLYEIRRVLYSLQMHSENPQKPMLQDYESITKKRLYDFISDEKKRIVHNSGLLQVIDIDTEKQKTRVGNIQNLRNLLEEQKKIIDNIEHYNSQMRKPKGILLVGAPGCGKSEAAKSVAAILEKPLLRLDIGALMGQYVGVSEHNLIEAIKIAEAAQPCVLWIDEIEKAFAGFGNTDTGNDITVMRMVGYFLTWMQERKSLVYLVATANNLDNLRPELLRKGRWDKIMYLTYPDEKGIVDIFNTCLKKYELHLDVTTELDANGMPKNRDFRELVTLIYKQEMSGADIDSVIVEAYNKAFVSYIDQKKKDEKDQEDEEININIHTCLNIVKDSNVLQSRKEAAEERIRKEMQNYQITSGRFDWDDDKEVRLKRMIDDYRISSDPTDYSLPDCQLIEEAITEIKLSMAKPTLESESAIRNLISKKIKKAKERNKKIVQILSDKIQSSDREKDLIKSILSDQFANKGREEQEKYYRSKGYESAS